MLNLHIMRRCIKQQNQTIATQAAHIHNTFDKKVFVKHSLKLISEYASYEYAMPV